MAALLDIVTKDSTDRSVVIRIIDSTDGTPETGVVFNTSGIDLWYRREGAAKVSITEATLAALTTSHTDGGFLHISDGEYRLDLPDAAFATGANYVDVGGTVTDMVVIGGRVRLVDYDLEDAVRLGLTALPNAAADAAGGLPISDAGGLDLDSRMPAAAAITNVNTVYNTDFSTNYNAVNNGWVTYPGGYYDQGEASAQAWPNNLSTLAISSGGDLTADITGSLSGSVGSVSGAVGSVTGNVGGNVTGSVGSVLGGVNTSAGTITTLDALDTAQDSQHGTTRSAIATAQSDLDTITGSDGVTLATTQGNYAPAVAGNQMDLVNAPNATAVTAIQSGLATASALTTVGGNVTAVKAVTDALTAAAAAKLATSAGTIVTGTVSTATTSPTTTVFAADDITEATADHYNGRIIIFTSGALQSQATDITDYALDSGEGKFTCTALTEPPANDDTFIIV